MSGCVVNHFSLSYNFFNRANDLSVQIDIIIIYYIYYFIYVLENILSGHKLESVPGNNFDRSIDITMSID